MDDDNCLNWKEVGNDFIISFFEGIADKEIVDHLKNCHQCNTTISPLLKESFEYMIGPKSKFMKNVEKITLVVDTHLGLDPPKFKPQ